MMTKIHPKILNALLLLLTCANLLHGADQKDELIDIGAYEEIKEACSRVVYHIDRDSYVWQWPDSWVQERLKIYLGGYLMEDLNTPESRKLYQQYEDLHWDIQKMMQLHLSRDEKTAKNPQHH